MFDSIVDFFNNHAFNITIILFLAYALRNFSMLFLRRIIQRTLRTEQFTSETDERKRIDTLVSTIGAGIRVAVWIITGLLLLAEIGTDITPLLAGAGVAGVALGFGAQSMVKDFLAGVFVITENHYRVGDIIQINRDVIGTVEKVTLRTTILRDLDGRVHTFSNGSIEVSTNMTMDYSNVNLDIGVSYATDIDKLEKIVNEVGSKLAADADWKDKLKEPPYFDRVKEFADSAVIVKILGRTEPSKKLQVTGELLRRLKKAFEKNDIEIPFPQRVIHEVKNSKKKLL